MSRIHTTTCIQAVTLLDEMGIAYEEIEIQLGDIKKNDYTFQCRSNVPLDTGSTVKEYANRMVAGDAFPTIVVFKKNNGQYVTVCGRHRLCAMLYAFKSTDTVRVLKVDDETEFTSLTLFSVRENTKNGIRQTNADLVERAARELVKIPLVPPRYEHPASVIKSVTGPAGIDFSHCKRNYYAKLAQIAFREAGLQPPDNVKALYSLWKYRKLPDWRNICRIVHLSRNAPRINEIIEGMHRDKIPHDIVASELELRLNNAMATVGLEAFKRQAIDPIEELANCLSLAERSFGDLPAFHQVSEERAAQVEEAMMMIKRAYRIWRETK